MHGAISPELADEARAACQALAANQLARPRRSGIRYGQIGQLLRRGPVFEALALNAKHDALVESILGAGYKLAQHMVTVRGNGSPGLTVHADGPTAPQVDPADGAVHVTSVFVVSDSFTAEDGATFVVPGTVRPLAPPRTGTSTTPALTVGCALTAPALPRRELLRRGYRDTRGRHRLRGSQGLTHHLEREDMAREPAEGLGAAGAGASPHPHDDRPVMDVRLGGGRVCDAG